MANTLIYLPNLDCLEVNMETAEVCAASAVYLLIDECGRYRAVCGQHIATDEKGQILPNVRKGG